MLFGDELFLGHDLLAWLVLAVGGAMAVGNAAALVRPPVPKDGRPAEPAPKARSIAYVAVGALAALWALATLVSH